MHDELPHPDVLAKLMNSHERLREELSFFAAAAASLESDHDDPEALGALRRSLDYFDRSVVRHEADEEKSLFPRLAHLPEAGAILAALAAEHASQRRIHDELQTLVPRDGTIARAAIPRLAELSRALRESYDVHLAREEKELFPIAQRTFDEAAHTAIAQEMEERRGRGGGGGGGGGGRGGGGGGGGRGGGGGGGGGRGGGGGGGGGGRGRG